MKSVLSVTETNRYIKEMISKDLILSNLWIKGEISNYKYHYSGHMYFTLKDESTLIKCVMFKSNATGLKFAPDNGMKVIIRGYVSVFERDGQYQLYAEEIQPDGMGNLHLAYEQLKKRLSEEGLFDEDNKKKIPYLPEKIAVITSPTGSVIKDIIHVLFRRNPNVALKIVPVAVQGDLAPKQIANAIRLLNEQQVVDVIILARGGGSLEELWAFNEEVVARSIFSSAIPIISAIGHETDYSISDFVADVRAPTPSAAAEIVMPDKQLLNDRILHLDIRLKKSLRSILNKKNEQYQKLAGSIIFKQPYNRVYQERMRLDILYKNMFKEISIKKERMGNILSNQINKLDALSPLKTLSRGYGIVKKYPENTIIKSIEDVNPKNDIVVTLLDGKLNCCIMSKEKGYIDG